MPPPLNLTRKVRRKRITSPAFFLKATVRRVAADESQSCPLRNNFPSCIRLVMKLLTTKEAASVLGVTDRRVRAMIGAGQLPAHQLGRDYAIEEKVLQAVAKLDRKPGRPPKIAANGRSAARKTKAKS